MDRLRHPVRMGLVARDTDAAAALRVVLRMTEPILAALLMVQLFGSPSPVASTAGISGTATWFAATSGTAAAGPRLRAWLGAGWRGTWVTVTANGHSVRVRLTDWCACGHSRVIDLARRDFGRLADPSVGVLTVRVFRAEAIRLPETDTAPY